MSVELTILMEVKEFSPFCCRLDWVSVIRIRISPLRDRDPRWFSCLSPLLLLIKLQHVVIVGGVVPAVSAVQTDAVINKDAG